MNLKDGDYVVGMWFCGDADVDFMATVVRPFGEPDFILEYRFRYHVDDKNFDSDDIKNWYRLKISELTEEEVIEKTTHIVNSLAAMMHVAPSFVSVRSAEPGAFIEAIKGLPFVHMKEIPKEQAKEWGFEEEVEH